jgi:hypothetical protein
MTAGLLDEEHFFTEIFHLPGKSYIFIMKYFRQALLPKPL